jgi:hypothetical protein
VGSNLISDDFGKLEERLERLETLASLNDQTVVSGTGIYDHTYAEVLREVRTELAELQEKVFERVLSSKSIEAKDFLTKIVKNLIEESRGLGLDIAVSVHGKGRVPMHLIEMALSSILACVRVSVESFRRQSGVDRIMKNLFPTCSFQMEIIAGSTEIHFRILHDGDGFSKDAIGNWMDTIRSIRENVAKTGGWFNFHRFENYGGSVEFKIPVTRTRFPGYIIRTGSFEAIVPASCVADTLQEISSDSLTLKRGEYFYNDRAAVGFLSSSSGFEVLTIEGLPRTEGMKAILLGAADFQFLILCDDFQLVEKIRSVEDEDLLDKASWFSRFGVFHEGIGSRLVPLMDGETLVHFHKQIGGAQ